MLVINSSSVSHGLKNALILLQHHGIDRESRNGNVRYFPQPVSIVHHNPMVHILNNETRKINPYLHFFEPLWILAGRNDVMFPAQFTSQMEAYSDNGITFNAAYGARMKGQIQQVISLLKNNPEDRQANLQIWSQDKDLGANTKDKACNMIVNVQINHEGNVDINVFNRSNDILWGCFGTNICQFAMLQNYIAASLGRGIGIYTQISCNLHLYTDTQKSATMGQTLYHNPNMIDEYNSGIATAITAVDIEEGFDEDLKLFFEYFDEQANTAMLNENNFKSRYFRTQVAPMYQSWVDKDTPIFPDPAEADWVEACNIWGAS